MSKIKDHIGKSYVLGEKYQPTTEHNDRAWRLIEKQLYRAGSKGVDFDALASQVIDHPTGSSQSFVRYCIDNGWLKPDQARNPSWDYDEIILALAFYLEHRPSIPDKSSVEVAELSETLRNLASRLGNFVSNDYRNPNGVYMKLMNFKSLDPSYQGRGLASASTKDREVFEAYEGNWDKLLTAAKAIREGIDSAEPLPAVDEPEDVETVVIEGRLLTRMHRYRERNAAIVRKKKEAVLRKTGQLCCEACGFDFEAAYGERGRGYIECHHTTPVSKLRPGQKTKLPELAVLCANCHRMVHRGNEWLTVSKLRETLARNQ